MARLIHCRHCGGSFRREDIDPELAWLLAGSVLGCRRCGHSVDDAPPPGGWVPPEVVDGKPGR